MAFDDEPKDGDFVRHIKTLNSRAGAADNNAPSGKWGGFSLKKRNKPTSRWGNSDFTQSFPASKNESTFYPDSSDATSTSSPYSSSPTYGKSASQQYPSQMNDASLPYSSPSSEYPFDGSWSSGTTTGQTPAANPLHGGRRFLASFLKFISFFVMMTALHRVLLAFMHNGLTVHALFPAVFLFMLASMLRKVARRIDAKQKK